MSTVGDNKLLTKWAVFLLLFWVLYDAILITTRLQRARNAETKIERPASLDALMMSAGRYPLSN